MSDVVTILRDRVGVTCDVQPASHLSRDLQLDSLAQLTLVVELENHFRVRFVQGEELEVVTVADITQLVARHLAAGS